MSGKLNSMNEGIQEQLLEVQRSSDVVQILCERSGTRHYLSFVALLVFALVAGTTLSGLATQPRPQPISQPEDLLKDRPLVPFVEPGLYFGLLFALLVALVLAFIYFTVVRFQYRLERPLQRLTVTEQYLSGRRSSRTYPFENIKRIVMDSRQSGDATVFEVYLYLRRSDPAEQQSFGDERISLTTNDYTLGQQRELAELLEREIAHSRSAA